MDSAELRKFADERGETPSLVGTGKDGTELYRFADGTEVAVTNAGLVTEDADGFTELRAAILAD